MDVLKNIPKPNSKIYMLTKKKKKNNSLLFLMILWFCKENRG